MIGILGQERPACRAFLRLGVVSGGIVRVVVVAVEQ